MKKIFPILFMFLSATAVAQNKDYLISLDGLGSLKIGMSLAELQKQLQTKIILKVIDIDSVRLTETVKAKYKGIDLEIDLFKRQDNIIALDGISSSSPLCKTKSGIGIGSTKLQVIAAYDGYHIDARPDFTYVEETNKTIKSKTNSSITIKEDREGYAIVFSLLNNKVVSFSIYPIYDDEE
ncbi:hypothetical protein CAP36_07630 [Chitinophagaceae bacterium IBVUCB2]|nr:hypothetical protein CAP36_07630 [Chitinophagaceae bacterium IBVUCB2]